MKTNKKLIILAVPFLLMGCGGKTSNKLNCPKTVSHYRADGLLTRKEFHSYNDDGLSSEYTFDTYDHEGYLNYKGKIINYYADGKLLSVESYGFDPKSNDYVISSTEYYSYTSNGDIKTLSMTVTSDNVTYNWLYNVYYYNEKNLLTQEEVFTYLDDVNKSQFISDYKIDFSYNENNQLTEEIRHFNDFGNYTNRIVYSYNSDGTLKEEKEYAGSEDDGINEEFTVGTRYVYDNSKNLIEKTVYGFDDSGVEYNKIKETYEYDKNNQILKYSYYHLSDEDFDSRDLVLDSYIVYEY